MSFEIKEWWGMHSDVAVLKLKSNERELAKKKGSFLDYFFFYPSLNLVHLHIFLPRLQYSYEGRFTMSTYLCIPCSQSFTLEHHFAGSLFERYINKKVAKGFFRRFTVRIKYIWTLLWRTSNSILSPIKPSSLKFKKSRDFHAGVSS